MFLRKLRQNQQWIRTVRHRERVERYEENLKFHLAAFDREKDLRNHFEEKFRRLFMTKGKKVAFNYANQLNTIRRNNENAEKQWEIKGENFPQLKSSDKGSFLLYSLIICLKKIFFQHCSVNLSFIIGFSPI